MLIKVCSQSEKQSERIEIWWGNEASGSAHGGLAGKQVGRCCD